MISFVFSVCFQIELAHWFYLDFLCSHKEQKQDKKLPSCGMKQFTFIIFQHVPFLHPHLPNLDKILEDWKQYKLSVPTYGAILISENLKSVLLVQSYFAKSSWGFPKGKINEHEDPEHCAIREVYEETGYDCSKGIKANDYIELIINFQYTRLYLVTGVPMTTKFQPRTRNEIKCCEWFPVEFLPTNKYQVEAKTNLGIGPNSFFMILPFIKQLKRWIKEFERRQKDEKMSANKSSNRKTRMQPNFDSNATDFQAHTSTDKENARRPRLKSTTEIEGFKLANFEISQNVPVAVPSIYGTPAPISGPPKNAGMQVSVKQEPRRRRLVFENKTFKREPENPGMMKMSPIILQKPVEKTPGREKSLALTTYQSVVEKPKKSFTEAFTEDAKKITIFTDFKFDRKKLMEVWNSTLKSTREGN